jgi:ABC-type multidrug transport system ATPase subunit
MTTMLELAAISKAFGRRPVLNQVWLQVRAGEAVGLVGRNGAGKTTMLRIAAGLVHADTGCVRGTAIEMPPARKSPDAPRLRYFGGEATLPPTICARRWARLLGCDSDEHRRIGRLSRGTRQLLGLRAVLTPAGADLIVLDEPWEGLDPTGSRWLTDRLRQLATHGAALLLSSHRLHDLDSVCTRFMLLDNGRCQPINGREGTESRVEQIATAVERTRGSA